MLDHTDRILLEKPINNDDKQLYASCTITFLSKYARSLWYIVLYISITGNLYGAHDVVADYSMLFCEERRKVIVFRKY